MNSQVTLVDPHSSTNSAGAEKGVTYLDFDQNDMTNTTIRIRGSRVNNYVVRTTGKMTTIHRCRGDTGDDIVFVTIERRHLRPDLVTFMNAQSVNLSAWLKSPVLAVFPISFEEGGKKFEWTESLAGQLFLREVTSEGTTTAGWFSRSSKRSDGGGKATQNAYLALKPEVAHLKDMILVACVLAEQKLRMAYGKNMGVAGVKSAGGQLALGALAS
ncbi:hypothetical protein V8B97DRAFT_2004770 [Scleroderma yunnanense]